jgi:hypothetical protein
VSRSGQFLARALLLLAVVVLAAADAVPIVAGGPCQKVFVPAYFYPGPYWTRAIDSQPPPSVMILDVTSSGAGSRPDRRYRATVSRAEAAGITILGYANTDYARRPAAAVRADIRHYQSWYHVGDIFLDQVSSDSGSLIYYRRLADDVHRRPGSIVMLNPGTYPARGYMSVGNVVLVFEGSYASYARLRVPGWAGRYPAARFAHAVYAVPPGRVSAVIGLSRRRHAGYLYVTGSTGTNPYATLPAGWPHEDAAIAAGCAVPTGRGGASRPGTT